MKLREKVAQKTCAQARARNQLKRDRHAQLDASTHMPIVCWGEGGLRGAERVCVWNRVKREGQRERKGEREKQSARERARARVRE